MNDARKGRLRKAGDGDVEVAAGAALMAGLTIDESTADSLETLRLEDLEATVQEQSRKPEQQANVKKRLQHQFLDAAKYGDFQKMFEMLEVTDPDLQKEVAERPFGEIRGDEIKEVRRWSAAMQMIYMNASLEAFKKSLRIDEFFFL